MNNELYNDQNAITQNDELINKKTQAIPKPAINIGIDDKSISDRIADVGVASQVDMSKLNSFSAASQTRDKLYELIDNMAQDPTIAAILETYAEDATEYNDEGRIVWVSADDAEVNSFITYLLDTMQVDKHAYQWIYNLCKYGDLYLQLFKTSEYETDPFFKNKSLNENIKIVKFNKQDKLVHYVEMVNNPAEMFELARLGKTAGYIKAELSHNMVANNNILSAASYLNKYKFKENDVSIFDADKFVHASLEESSNRSSEEVELFTDEKEGKSITYNVKKGQSLLANTFKIWRELSLLENSILLNRITKSAIVRLINVEVGDMPKEDVYNYLERIKSLVEQKQSLAPGEGMTEYTNPGPIENNVYVPTRNQQGTITASQIGGDVNVGELPDIEYFQNKFFGALRVPKQFFGLTNDAAGFNGGTSLAIISSRYAKMIKRIQNALIQALTDLVNILLLDKGLDKYVNKFTICMQPPTTQEEIDRRDNLSSKVGIMRDIMGELQDIEDPAIRLKILKSLMSNIVSDNEIISLLDEQINKLENEMEEETPIEDSEEDSDIDMGSGDDLSLDLDKELGLDSGLDTEISETETDEENSEEVLPTPEELGVDMTDLNAE